MKEGEYEICQKLVEKGADVNVCDAQKNSVLNTACWKGHTDIVKLLVRSGAQLNAQNDHESTPLFTAAYKGYFDIVSVLVEACCDLDLQNVHGQSPLHAAVKNEHISCVHRLVDGGCNINFIDTDFKSPLMVASELGLTEVAIILLEKGKFWFYYFFTLYLQNINWGFAAKCMMRIAMYLKTVILVILFTWILKT